MSKRKSLLLTSVTLALACQARATVLMEYDASTGDTPDSLPNPWQRYGVPMINIGGVLQQDNTFDDPTTESGEYLSPSVPAGTMSLNSGQYGIETTVRPLTDVPFLGGSHYANAYVFWSDDSYAYNITIDKDTDDSGPGTTGGIKYGQNSMSDAVTGIDWSVPHDIYVGYRSSSPFGVFDFYVDGVLKSTRSAGSMARSGSFARDAVDFGDGTTGQGLDIAVEWYSVKIHDTAIPVIPPSEWNVNSNGIWANASNWTAGVPDINTGAATAKFGSVINAAHTVTLSTSQAIGNLIFDNANTYTISGAGSLQFTNPGNAHIDVLQGHHVISTNLSITSPLQVTTAAGTSLSLAGSTISTWVGLAKEGDGTLSVTELHATTVSVNGGRLNVLANGGNSGISRVNSLGIAPTATLDLNDNDLVVNSGSFSTLQALVLGGYRGSPDTTATGIVSSTSQNADGGTTILALFDNSLAGFSDYPFGSGQTIAANAIVGKYTYIGDTNYDGQVTPQDYTAVDANLNTSVDPAISWFYGDTNFDGNIDASDYTGIDAALGLGVGNPLAVQGLAAVPEPASLALFSSLGLLAARRRARRS